jgi:uncharacterized FlaG/YvyC family protein
MSSPSSISSQNTPVSTDSPKSHNAAQVEKQQDQMSAESKQTTLPDIEKPDVITKDWEANLEQQLDTLNTALQHHANVDIQVSSDAKEVVIHLIDQKTKAVIQEIPSPMMQKISANIEAYLAESASNLQNELEQIRNNQMQGDFASIFISRDV